MSNVDPLELDKFASRAQHWWEPQGPFRTLHEINDLRLGYTEQHCALAGARVLDVGCGGGIFAEGLAARGAKVLGVDLADANIEAAREHAARSALPIDYRCASVESIAAAMPGTFDLVTCLEMLEHVPEPGAIVAACAAALRPGGTAVFSTINRNPKSFAFAIVGAEYLLGLVPRGTHEYLKLIKPAELASWCRAACLETSDVTGLHMNPVTRTYWLGGNVDVNYFVCARRAVRT